MRLLRDGLLSQSKGTLTTERGVQIEATRTSGREFVVAHPDGKHDLIVRIYWVNKTIYEVAVIVPKSPSDNQLLYASRFLESFLVNGG